MVPVRRETTVWSETWRAPEQWLGAVEARLQEAGAVTSRGGDLDRWDLEVRGGLVSTGRLLMAIEEHGGGRQLVRFQLVPRLTWLGAIWVGGALVLAALAVVDNAWPVAAALALAGALVIARLVLELGHAVGAMARALVETP